ncbi:MAG TPA: hypothetical protein VNL16_18385 [Chloroflexota bacterium]|nr:hypothetical protein [Chloroflexota bacterium]
MAQHNAQYFLKALRALDWTQGYTGNQLMNLFFDMPIGWFVHVPKERLFTRWEDFWMHVTPISTSTRGPAVHARQAEKFLREANQRGSTGWGR